MIGSDWVYCLAGIAASFLISLFFYWLGGNEKLLFVDVVADSPYGDTHNCACKMKNIGRKSITVLDFAPKDQPHFMTEGMESFSVIPPGKANINGVQARKEGNDIYISFDYLKRGETVFLIMKNQKGTTGYRATQINGIQICYTAFKRIVSVWAGTMSMGLILGVGLFLFGLNVKRSVFLCIIGFLTGLFILSNIINHYINKKHIALMKMKEEI